tara:strand:+ start:78 stop:1151 length:1074 start_codon:yes stop_codon:yes gene_type:complete
MKTITYLLLSIPLAPAAIAQNVAVFPDDYVAVTEGPFNSPNLPLASGTSRVQCLYNGLDMPVPVGDMITKLGFREDRTLTNMEAGVAMQLEIRMGWSTLDEVSMTTNFDNNYDGTPVTVFGPALFTLPDLRDPNAPLPDGQFFIPLTTSFAYVPNGKNLIVEYRIFGTATGGGSFNYRLDRADYYSPRTYGQAGCMHSGGVAPNLTLAATRPGLTWSCSATSGPPNAPAFVAIDIGAAMAATPYPLTAVFPGISATCMGQMPVGNSVLLGGSASSSGSKSWSFLIPNNNIWAGINISAQALFLDFFSPGQVVVSNAGTVLTGTRPRTTILRGQGVPTVVTTGQKSSYYCPVAFFEHQ